MGKLTRIVAKAVPPLDTVRVVTPVQARVIRRGGLIVNQTAKAL